MSAAAGNPGTGLSRDNDVIIVTSFVTSLVESAAAGATSPVTEARQSSRKRMQRFFLLRHIY